MNLSEIFIRRPVMTILLMVALLAAGTLSYLKLPISNLPNVTYPIITVSVSYPGMLPEVMAQSIALPLEKELMAIPGSVLVSSNNTLGQTRIVIQFDINKDMTEAAQDVQAAIITATPNLPTNLPYAPTYRKVNPAELPVFYLVLTSKNMKLNELYTYGKNLIGQRISMLAGVSQVTVFGSPLAIRVQVDPGKLAANNLSLEEVANQMFLGSVNLPTGQLDGPITAPTIAVDGQLLNSSAWDDLIIAYRNNAPVRIQDIGKAVNSFRNDKTHVEYIQKDLAESAILLSIQKESTANAVSLSENIHLLLNQLKEEIPEDIELDVFYDRAPSIIESVDEVKFTLILALFLVMIVIAFYLGKLADTVIPSILMPMAIIGTFIVMEIYEFNLDNLSLLALTLSIGFIIDDAIVVIENIVRKQEDGKERLQASIEGTKEISFTIVSMTLSLIAVFIPLLFMSGLLGKILNEFAITLLAVTAISGFISLSLTPLLCSRFLSPKNSPGRLFRFSNRINEQMRSIYGKILHKSIERYSLSIAIGFTCLALTLLLFYIIPTDFIPNEDTGFFIVYTQEREGGSSKQMQKYQKEVAEVLINHPAVDKIVATSSFSQYHKGENLVVLKPYGERKPLSEVIKELTLDLSEIPGVQSFIRNVPLIDLAVGLESRGEYQLAMHSLSSDKVYAFAKKMLKAMREDPAFYGVSSDMEINAPQIDVSIIRDKSSSLGISAADIENAFNFGYSYNYVNRIETGIDQYDIILQILEEQQKDTTTFNSLWMRSSTSNQLIPMGAVAKWEEKLGPSSVNHIDQFPSVTINFNLAPGVTLEDTLKKIEHFQKEYADPAVYMQPIGAIQAYQEAITNGGVILILAIFVIYIVLGMLYENFFHPLTVLSTLLPSLLGGLLTLWFFNLPLSLYAFLGIILLIGIVKKNGIMMIDFALENIRKEENSYRQAIYDAALARFRPIMMTTVAAIFGAVPIVLGLGPSAEARKPLGLVIIGGLLFSQLITLFITPTFFLLLQKMSNSICKK